MSGWKHLGNNFSNFFGIVWLFRDLLLTSHCFILNFFGSFFIWLGKYTAILAILVVGSFIIPMGQYFWYVRDDDSSDRFFNAEDIPDPVQKKKKSFFGKKAAEVVPEPEPKKKGFFGRK